MNLAERSARAEPLPPKQMRCQSPLTALDPGHNRPARKAEGPAGPASFLLSRCSTNLPGFATSRNEARSRGKAQASDFQHDERVGVRTLQEIFPNEGPERDRARTCTIVIERASRTAESEYRRA